MTSFPVERSSVVAAARVIARHGLTHGRTGNVSARVDNGFLITPTGGRLESVLASELSLVDLKGHHLDGPRPSKESFLHAAMLRARPHAQAVVHTHSTCAAAISCLDLPDGSEPLVPLTAYYAMRVTRMPLLPYFAPGDVALGPVAAAAASEAAALLLRNHGPIVAGLTLDEAVEAVLEVEATAHLQLLLHGQPVRPLSDEQRKALQPETYRDMA